MHLKMSSAKWRSFCLSHNVLIIELCHQCSCAVPCYSIQADTMISLPDRTLYWIQQCGDLMLNIYQNLNTPKHSFRSSSWASYGVSILKETWFGYDGTALNHVESVVQVAISLTIFHHFSNAMKISFCFHPYSIKVIATMFCTCPDSLAVMAYSVMACAKYCCDLMTRNWITEKKELSIKFELWVKNCQWNGSGGCFTNVLRALPNILLKFVYCRNRNSYENFKLKLCMCAQNHALDSCTKFQLEILTINLISGIAYFGEIILACSWNVRKTTPWIVLATLI